jgi:putative transposase
MRAHEDQFKISTMSVVLKVSRSGYYVFNRKESKRSQQNRALLVKIEKVHRVSRQAYGAVKTWRELKSQGAAVRSAQSGTVEAARGHRSSGKRRFRITTQSRAGMVVAERTVSIKNLKVESVNRVWVDDITFIPTQPDGCI